MSTEWYVRIDGTEYGPETNEQLRKLALTGQMTRDSLVRRGTSGPWKQAGQIIDLFPNSAPERPAGQRGPSPSPAKVGGAAKQRAASTSQGPSSRWPRTILGAGVLLAIGFGLGHLRLHGAIFSLGFFVMNVFVGWVAPIVVGVKYAKKKNYSPHWMWFGIHPVTGWIACIYFLGCPACTRIEDRPEITSTDDQNSLNYPCPTSDAIGMTPKQFKYAAVAWACLIFFVILTCANLLGERPDLNYDKGASVGQTDGAKAGQSEGYDGAFKSAEKSAYNYVLDKAVSEGRFRMDVDMGLQAILGGLAAGFVLQYTLFYLLRWTGVLWDVDGMLLPDGDSEGTTLVDGLPAVPNPQIDITFIS